jgi:hypothetical protein
MSTMILPAVDGNEADFFGQAGYCAPGRGVVASKGRLLVDGTTTCLIFES